MVKQGPVPLKVQLVKPSWAPVLHSIPQQKKTVGFEGKYTQILSFGASMVHLRYDLEFAETWKWLSPKDPDPSKGG